MDPQTVQMIVTGGMFLLAVLGFVWNARNGLKSEAREDQKERWAELQALYDRVKDEKEALEKQLSQEREQHRQEKEELEKEIEEWKDRVLGKRADNILEL